MKPQRLALAAKNGGVRVGRSRMEHALGYFLATIMFVVAVLVFWVSFRTGLNTALTGLNRFDLTEPHVLHLEEPGNYVLFGESTTNQIVWENLEPRITHLPTGQHLPLTSPKYKSGYSFEGRRGRALGEFSVVAPGQYGIDLGIHASDGIVVALGSQFNRIMVLTLLWALALFSAFLVITAILFLRQLGKATERYLYSR